jgi:type IV pilus assembly protein PilC
MPVYNFTALTRDGKRQSGTIDAPSKDLALTKLREEGLVPLDIDSKKAATNVEDIIARLRPVKQETLVYFTRQLATMIDSGMSPLKALSALEEQEDNVKFREIIADIITRVEAGQPLSEALAAYPETFSMLYVSMVNAGELSGNLHGALAETALQLEKSLSLKRVINSATMYPKVVMVFAFFITSGLLVFLVPKFAQIFQDTAAEAGKTDAQLPLLTRVVMKASGMLYPAEAAKNLWWFLQVFGRMAILFVILFIVIPRFFRWLLKKPGPRARWDAFKLKAPLGIGPLIQKIVIARFARTFSSLLNSGVPAQEAMRIVADTSGNVLVAEAVMKAREEMLSGSTISAPLANSGAFPSMVTRMIEVGEDTGQMDVMLLKVAEFFEEDVDAKMKGLSALIEPLLIIMIGGIIGVIVISIYLPMFSIYQNI